MLKMLGIILLLAGSTGVAWSYCNEEKERIRQIKEIKQIYHLAQNEMIYAKAAIPDLCQCLSAKAAPPYAGAFAEIYQEMNKNNGSSFAEIWQVVMTKNMASTRLRAEERKLLLDFPECLGYLDKEGQAESLERYIVEADRISNDLEKEVAGRTKVIMSCGIMGGILMVILLL